MSDDELVEQIRLGDEDAAEALVRRYYSAILRYCRWHCESREKAEDLTQETFLRLFKSIHSYDRKKKFRAYLYTIASHLCIDESRKRKTEPLENADALADGKNVFVRAEEREEVNRLLEFLNAEQREAVILRYGEQLSYGEIARITGCNMRTVQSRVRNALKIMRERL